MKMTHRLALLILVVCALVWGSSFILMKRGLVVFTASQVAALRIGFAGLGFAPIILYRLLRHRRRLPYGRLLFGTAIGNLIPAFLFSLAQTRLQSGTTGVLNTLTPLSAMLLGLLLYGQPFRAQKLVGVLLGLAGASLLVLLDARPGGDLLYALLVVLATLLYGLHTNYVKFRIHGVSTLEVSGFGLVVFALPALLGVLLFTPTQGLAQHPHFWHSLLALVVLGVVGTSFVLWLFFQALKVLSPVAATSVTYLMPVVALFWGTLDGEPILLWHGFGLAAILLGVWLVSRVGPRG
ncbi:MAG: DMT family transporter [Bacteroidetes bacterium]|jgi:drug/metabolite transporter (DMT)-like permease|nr:DMT family transporter [Bacteroidota bacterium]